MAEGVGCRSWWPHIWYCPSVHLITCAPHELTFGDLAERCVQTARTPRPYLQSARRLDSHTPSLASSRRLQHEAQMFRSQRNFYLTGFCMVQLLVIARIYSLLKQVNKLEATQTALKKQAEGAAAAYKQIQQEKDSSAKASTSGGGAQAAAKEVDDLKKKVADAEAARDAAVKGAEALKKQAEGLSTEYTRLQKEKESLQNKLDDFEIMIMKGQMMSNQHPTNLQIT